MGLPPSTPYGPHSPACQLCDPGDVDRGVSKYAAKLVTRFAAVIDSPLVGATTRKPVPEPIQPAWFAKLLTVQLKYGDACVSATKLIPAPVRSMTSGSIVALW